MYMLSQLSPLFLLPLMLLSSSSIPRQQSHIFAISNEHIYRANMSYRLHQAGPGTTKTISPILCLTLHFPCNRRTLNYLNLVIV